VEDRTAITEEASEQHRRQNAAVSAEEEQEEARREGLGERRGVAEDDSDGGQVRAVGFLGRNLLR